MRAAGSARRLGHGNQPSPPRLLGGTPERATTRACTVGRDRSAGQASGLDSPWGCTRMPELRDRVWDIIHQTAELPTPARIDRLVELVNEEKAKSYGIGFQDGARKVRTTA